MNGAGWCAVMATIGPSSQSDGIMSELVSAGVTAARLDLSVGTLEYHLRSIDMFHQAALRAGRLCAMCLDVAGRNCQVVQPFTLTEQGWPIFQNSIRISDGQTVALTVGGGLYIPNVRRAFRCLPISCCCLFVCNSDAVNSLCGSGKSPCITLVYK